MRTRRSHVAGLALLLALGAGGRASAGSTEPALAVAAASTSVEGGIVTVEVSAEFDYGDVVRLGYPLAVVLTQGTTITRLYLDGSATVESGGGAATPLSAGAGIVAIAPAHLTAVLPPDATAAGAAALRLEAAFDGNTLRSNTVPITW